MRRYVVAYIDRVNIGFARLQMLGDLSLVGLWRPSRACSAGRAEGTARIGFVTAVPYIVAVVVMLLVGHSADRRRERRWHTAVAMIVGALGLVLSVAAGDHTTAVALVVGAVAVLGIPGRLVDR